MFTDMFTHIYVYSYIMPFSEKGTHIQNVRCTDVRAGQYKKLSAFSVNQKESKDWVLRTMVLEKTQAFLGQQDQPVNSKGNQPWIFIVRADAEAPILWPPDAKNWFIGKDPDAGKDWRQEEKRRTECEIVRWHHRLDGHEFEQPLGDGEEVKDRETWSAVVHGVA